MKIYTFLLLIFLIFKNLLSFCQDKKYTRQIIKTLCSPSFEGRGYVNKGDIRTARYLVNQFRLLNIDKFNNSYFQHFNISVNTFPSKMSVQIDKKGIRPGKDYLIEAYSPSIKGKFQILNIGKDLIINTEKLFNIKNLVQNKFLLVDSLGTNISIKKYIETISLFAIKNNAAGLILINYSGFQFYPCNFVSQIPIIQLNYEIWNRDCQTIDINIKNHYFEKYQTQNVIGYLQGKVDSFIVFTAHYDHLGRMGKEIYFPGANDNASGTAMVLNLARYFSLNSHNLYYSIAFFFFSAEELGLVGSEYYCQNPIFPLNKIKFLINLDVIGSGEKGITIVNGSVFKDKYNLLTKINKKENYLDRVDIRGKAAISDHFPFFEKGIDCFFIYTTGEYKQYHNIFDKPEILPLNKFDELFLLIKDFTISFNPLIINIPGD